MKKFNFLSSLNVSKDVEMKLSSNLQSIVSGSDEVIENPILLRKPAETILKEWDVVYEANIGLVNSVLRDLEASNRSKFGPRSISLPWEDRRAGVLAYFEPESVSKMPQTQLSKVLRQNLRPKDIPTAIKLLKNNTNSGLPFYTKKGNVKENYVKNWSELLERRDPCVLFTRTQEKSKTRNVWGYPMADTLFEMTFYGPILDYQRKLDWRNSLIGSDAVNRKLTSIILHAMRNKLKLLSIDFTLYDTSVKTTLQEACFDYFKMLFQPKYHKSLDRIFKRFNTIGLITPDGVYSGPHGVPSGSTFTNEVDSVAQYLIATAYGLVSNVFDIQGDDGVYAVQDPDSLKDFFRSFGLNVNEEKSYVHDDCLIYLQNLYHIDYIKDGIIGGIYPTYRALNRILYLERYIDFVGDDIKGKDYFSIRTICILENCKFHPLFRDLVELVYKSDKYKLAYSDEGLAKYIERFDKSNGVANVLKFRYEDEPSGLNDFETVKIIRELNQEFSS
jgi:hypothetical protein